MTDRDPAELLAASERTLKWAAFLLGALLFILLIDVQLSRSIGRQAVAVSQKLAAVARMTDGIMDDLLKGAGGGQRSGVAKAAGGGGDAGVGGPDGVVGDAPGPEGADRVAGAGKAKAPRRAARTVDRASGDGPGTVGDTGG